MDENLIHEMKIQLNQILEILLSAETLQQCLSSTSDWYISRINMKCCEDIHVSDRLNSAFAPTWISVFSEMSCELLDVFSWNSVQAFEIPSGIVITVHPLSSALSSANSSVIFNTLVYEGDPLAIVWQRFSLWGQQAIFPV